MLNPSIRGSRIFPLQLHQGGGRTCPTMSFSATAARNSSIKFFPSSITRQGRLNARTVVATMSSSAGPPFPPSHRKRAHDEKSPGESGGSHGLLQASHSDLV